MKKLINHIRSEWFRYGLETIVVIIGILVADNQKVGAIIADDSNEGFGINSTDELSMVEELIKSGTY